ncbi:hypothetical protein V1264_002094 [Littorina saxatilis]|uniref:F-box domain-containing protein n=2 Tax=Littorina saxatilis TaxID=31220 RepID=A0AAN9C2N9_9CAEN
MNQPEEKSSSPSLTSPSPTVVVHESKISFASTSSCPALNQHKEKHKEPENCAVIVPTSETTKTSLLEVSSTGAIQGDSSDYKLLDSESNFFQESWEWDRSQDVSQISASKSLANDISKDKNQSSLEDGDIRPSVYCQNSKRVTSSQLGESCSKSQAENLDGDSCGVTLNGSENKVQNQAEVTSGISFNKPNERKHAQQSEGHASRKVVNEAGGITLEDDSEEVNSMTASTESQQTFQSCCATQATLEHLPRDVLLNIVQHLPTVSLIACATAHEAFADVINDVQFLNMHTRLLLGFRVSEKDITYDSVPAPVAPIQDLWFQLYLHRAAPNLVGVVRPGVICYDLLCFKHLLDSWILQGLGYKYWMFISDVLKSPNPPPLSFMKCKRLIIISKHVLRMLTKVAMCHPEILLLTVNDFESLSICGSPPSDLDDAWDNGVPAEWQAERDPQYTCEVVSRQRGLALASFFFTFDTKLFIGWSGIIDYSTFRWRDTWGLYKFLPEATLSDIKEVCENLFPRFIEYVGTEYISVHCPNAFLFRGLLKLVQQRDALLPKMQDALEKSAQTISKKMTKILPADECRKLKSFLDGVPFMVNEDNPGSAGSQKKTQQRESSKTFEVAVQRYLHRYLNQMIGRQVLQLYTDPTCHHVLCITCRNANIINPTPFCVCMERVGPQRIPFKIWPPHLLHFAVSVLPALARLVSLDIELWRRSLLSEPLSEKVALFVSQALNAAHFDFSVDPSRIGIIAKRLLM